MTVGSLEECFMFFVINQQHMLPVTCFRHKQHLVSHIILVTGEIITSKSLTYPFTKPSCPCFSFPVTPSKKTDRPPMTPSNYSWEDLLSLYRFAAGQWRSSRFDDVEASLEKKTKSLKPPTNIIPLSIYIYIEFYAILSHSIPFNP